MTSKTYQKGASVVKNKILFIALLAVGSLLLTPPLGATAQTPSPSPTPSASSSSSSSSDSQSGGAETTTIGGYEINSSVELGVRGLDVNGNNDKFRSDFNYKPGFRVFDSSFSMEVPEGERGQLFDSLTFTSTGWGADPYGAFRGNVEKLGAYRFDANVRRVHYFNRLFNHINLGGREPGWKEADTKRNFGDFDLTVFPQNENFRLRFGGSFYHTSGIAGFTTRPFSDEFPITRNVDLSSVDLRAGVDGKLLGFKLSLTGGTREFDEDTDYTLRAPHPGVNTTDVSTLTALERIYPNKGNTKYGIFSIHRLFARRLDFTGRFIYSVTDRNFDQSDRFAGRGVVRPSPIVRNIISDLVQVVGDAKRPQARGDLGLTYAFNEKFRISNTFSFERFDISGGSVLSETVVSQQLSNGAPLPTTFSSSFYYRQYDFERFMNTVEGDYQFSPRFGLNVGYRFSHRKIEINGFNQTITGAINNPSRACSVSASENPRVFCEEEENSTSTFLFATRIRPTNNWAIFANVEHGEADNAFTRLSNYNFTNVRVRSNWNYKQFTFNVMGISRNNENPSLTSAIRSGTGAILIPEGELIGNVRNRIFSAYVDWTPGARLSVSTGYNYHHLTSETDIVVPLAALTRGYSQFFMRDSYMFVDVAAEPINRVSIFASYRFNKDGGQGDRVSTAPQFIVSSYPFRMHMPEVRLAFRLSRNIDWNVGYQYYSYRENLERAHFDPIPPNQNYNAHLPYTSLRIYFGRKE